MPFSDNILTVYIYMYITGAGITFSQNHGDLTCIHGELSTGLLPQPGNVFPEHVAPDSRILLHLAGR